MLDNIPVIKEEIQKEKATKKRLEIEDLVEKFLSKKVAPNSKEPSPDIKESEVKAKLLHPKEKHQRQESDFTPIINMSRADSFQKGREAHTISHSYSTPTKAPMVNLDAGLKNDQTGLYTFMYGKGVDSASQEAKDSLKEIINIQESYISKRSNYIVPELLKEWRKKVFELIFESKKTELLNNKKLKILENDKEKVMQELDQVLYNYEKMQKELEAYQYESINKPREAEEFIKHYKEQVFQELKNILQANNQFMEEKEQKIEDAMFELQSYAKRLQIIEKRIKTASQLIKSERESYAEKYRQLNRNSKKSREKELESDSLLSEIRDLKKNNEEKELTISTLRHELKLSKDSYEKLSQSKTADSDRIVQEALRKVTEIESVNQALNNDNTRLISRIKELENLNISLKTDIATQGAVVKNNEENINFKYQNIIDLKDGTIKA